MKKAGVHIDFSTLGVSMRAHVRKKAIQYGSTIVYKHAGKLIEENPRTGEKRILQPRIAVR